MFAQAVPGRQYLKMARADIQGPPLDAVVTLEDLKPNVDLRGEGKAVWSSIGDDPSFACSGEFDARDYVLHLDAVVEGVPPRQPMAIYYAPAEDQFSEDSVHFYRGLQREHEHNPRSLELRLPVGTRAIRFDPLAGPGRFRLNDFHITPQMAASPAYLEHPVEHPSVATNWSYFEDGMATMHNCDFMSSPRFLEAYAAGERTGSWKGSSVHWRAYVCCWAAERGLGLEGDFIECGVHLGGYAAAIVKYLDFDDLDRKFYLLDTFAGLPGELLSEEEKRHGVLEYEYGDTFEAVQRTFASHRNVELVRGRVPDTLPAVSSDRIAFLSLDMNNTVPEIAAAETFWSRLEPGAVVVLDDYGWERHIEQKRAFDKFAAARGVTVLSLPTGQGLIIKP